MRDVTLPCGRCDIGVYNELAMLNKTARAFGALPAEERLRQMPMCKTQQRPCVGACDFHDMICVVDAKTSCNTCGGSGVDVEDLDAICHECNSGD